MKKKAKKLVSMLLAAVLMLTMVPLSAGAEVIGSGDTYGNWRWSLDRDTGTLTISGLGSMENYYSATDAPWYPLRNEIRTAIFSEGVTNIGDNAFASATVTDEGYNNLSKIILPQSVTNIGYGVFSQMRTLYDCLPIYSAGPAGGGYDYEFQWTDRIPDRAFCALRGLQQITIPESVTYIGDFAFWGCGITSIDLPSSLKELGPYAFSNSSL